MGDHTDPGEQPLLATEPAAASEAARILIAVFVGTGWLTISSQTTDWIISAVGLIASIALTYWTRRSVTPVAAPRDASRLPLVSVSSKSN